MAMTGAAMASNVVNALKASNPDITGAIETQLISKWTSICTGILTEFATNGTVLPGTFLTIDNVTAIPEPVVGIGGPIL